MEHTQKWEQFRNTQPSTEYTTTDEPVMERDFWVAQNLNNKGRVYGFGSEGLVMKQQSCQSTSAWSSSVNNYDAHEMATRLNESVVKAVKDAHYEELHRGWLPNSRGIWLTNRPLLKKSYKNN